MINYLQEQNLIRHTGGVVCISGINSTDIPEVNTAFCLLSYTVKLLPLHP